MGIQFLNILQKVMPNEADIVKYECCKVKIINKEGFIRVRINLYNGKVYTEDGKIDNGYIHVKDGTDCCNWRRG